MIVDYYREQTDIILKSLIESNINLNISLFYEKQDSYRVIKELTYHIGNVGLEVKSNHENRQDIDIATSVYGDAKYIRKEMQVNNEEMYYLYIYLLVYAEDIKELEYLISKIEGISQSKGLQTRRANFRQEELFKSCLPIMENNQMVKNVSKRNILTSSLVSTYPFISSSIFDKEGIFIGTNIYNNSLVFIDRYDTQKYKNANICIFGTSGAGKSFYTKLLILRYRLMGIKQYIIDPEREYVNINNTLKGTRIIIGPNSNTYINILEIRKESIEDGENGYLATKIGKLIGFFNLIFGELNEEEKALLEEKLIETYNEKNIDFDDKSLYKKENKKIIFKNKKDMPILEDSQEKEEINQVYKKIKNLKEIDVKIITMFYYSNKSIKDIAKELNISEVNTKTRLHRIRKKIKQELKQGGFFNE